MTFEDLKLSTSIMQAIRDMDFVHPTEIQALAIPTLLGHGGDFCGQAQTGTGKTGAFVIPLLEKIRPDCDDIQSFILAPTRELANQITGEIAKFAKYLPVKVTAVYGGVSYGKQISEITKKRPHIVVATPGRALDLIAKGILRLGQVKYVVVDEADEMLNMGFLEDVDAILAEMNGNRKIWMFSATMPPEIVTLIRKRFQDTSMVKVESPSLTNEDITQYYCMLYPQDLFEGLVRFVEAQQDLYALVFCETREEVKNFAQKLQARGIAAVALHGELNQGQRDEAMELFRSKRMKMMICTDVAARGIDIGQIAQVINIKIPRNLDAYIHRIGRTGRAGAKGISITFLSQSQFRLIRQLEKLTKSPITPFQLPKIAAIKRAKVARELEKSVHLRDKVCSLQDNFELDTAFTVFEEFTKELATRDDLLKWIFAWRFGSDLRKLSSAGELASPTLAPPPKRAYRPTTNYKKSQSSKKIRKYS